ncbi:MAG: hypothetical protein JWQ88_187 [Rhodoferax sp.]|nr:hypothetical protein [Rhodoferax sp.]
MADNFATVYLDVIVLGRVAELGGRAVAEGLKAAQQNRRAAADAALAPSD